MNINGYEIKVGADLQSADLRNADLQGANLQSADLRNADLQGANLRNADLRSVNLDFSCWPLWCGSKGVILDDNQIDQLCMHLAWVWPYAPVDIRERAKKAEKKRSL